jgi:hypothetical protein
MLPLHFPSQNGEKSPEDDMNDVSIQSRKQRL